MEMDTDALYASEVRPEIWTVAELRTEPAGFTLVAYLSDGETTRLELNVRRTGAGDVCVAVEDAGINVFLAPDADSLAHSVGRHLHAAGFLRFPEEVEIHTAEPPRAERLEAEQIWTHEPEEVQTTWS
jgi:hypothetical protein